MKKYVVDTNVFLRFFLKDNQRYFNQAKRYFTQAKEGKISLILLPQVIFEINYVLKGVYSLTKKKRVKILSNLIKSPDFKVEERKMLIEVVDNYQMTNVDLVDIYLSAIAKQKKAQILSFDKDFKKIKSG